MKITLALSCLTACALLTAAQAPPAVQFAGHEKVAAALAKGGPLLAAPNLTVSGSHREKAGQVEVHEKETDVIYVQDGEATFVAGGKMIGGKQTKPGQSVGTSIEGGEEHHLTKGDTIVVQAGTPHWFKEVPKSVSYFVVKVLK